MDIVTSVYQWLLLEHSKTIITRIFSEKLVVHEGKWYLQTNLLYNSENLM